MKFKTPTLPGRLAALLLLLLPVAARGAGELNLFGWSEYIPQPVLEGFTRETGIKVNFETYSSNEEMLAKLVAGGGRYDLVQPSDFTAEAMIRRKLLQPLDRARLTGLGNLAPEFTGRAHDPEGRYTVPYMSGSVGIGNRVSKNRELTVDFRIRQARTTTGPVALSIVARIRIREATAVRRLILDI